VSSTAPADGKEAAVSFPGWSLGDNLTPPNKITVACYANLTKGAPPTEVTSGETAFSIGTTAVWCVATDEAKNPSAKAAFSVVVGCGAGFEFKGGKCTGEGGWGVLKEGKGVECPKWAGACQASSSLHRMSTPPFPAKTPTDVVPPTLALTGLSPVLVKANPGANTALVSKFPDMEAYDPNGTPVALPADSISCNATIGGVNTEVTTATPFPYDVTSVACVARDAAGNPSLPVSFAVHVVCEPGYSVRADGGVCLSEWR
jgi:hypothetical protein